MVNQLVNNKSIKSYEGCKNKYTEKESDLWHY